MVTMYTNIRIPMNRQKMNPRKYESGVPCLGFTFGWLAALLISTLTCVLDFLPLALCGYFTGVMNVCGNVCFSSPTFVTS